MKHCPAAGTGADVPVSIDEHETGVSAGLENWGRRFAQHLQTGGRCFGVIWCWKVKLSWLDPYNRQPGKSEGHGSHPDPLALPVPSRAQHSPPQDTHTSGSWGAAAVCTEESPGGARDSSAVFSLSPHWHNHHPTCWVWNGWKYPSGTRLSSSPGPTAS